MNTCEPPPNFSDALLGLLMVITLLLLLCGGYTLMKMILPGG